MLNKSPKPAIFKALLWGIFSATATLSTVLLPVLIYALLMGKVPRNGGYIFQLYFFLVLFTAIYHSWYRVKTVLADLGWVRYEKILTVIFCVIVTVESVVAALMIFG